MDAWKVPYIGTTHHLLHSTINDMNEKRGTKLYANLLPIVQSSGTGKSRTVHELARLVFTLPFNLRLDKDSTGFPYPFPDVGVRNYLVNTNNEHATFDTLRMRYLLFFTYVFAIVQERLMSYPKFESVARLAGKWREELETSYDEVSVREKIYTEAVRNAADDATAKEKEMAIATVAMSGKAIVERAAEAAKALTDRIDELTSKLMPKGAVRLVLYFDEAHCLSDSRIYNNTRNYYDALCSALNEFNQAPIFAIMISTNSSLSRFSPQNAHHSARVVNAKEDTLQVPFSEMPFDCLHDGKPVFIPGMKIHDIEQVKFMVQFGRPLFSTRWNSAVKGGMVEVTNPNNMVAFAKMKLTGMDYGGSDISKTEPLPLRSVLAALSTRLLLDFEPRREAGREMEKQLIEGNMRIVYSVLRHREYFRSGTPSEPILAEAATVVMRELTEKNFTIPALLSSFVNNGFLEKGESGELVGRLLLTTVFDKTVEEHPNVEIINPSVHLFAFLRNLLGPANFGLLLNTHANKKTADTTFQDDFKNARVRFTHFARFGKDNRYTPRTLLAAFVRGMAIQCSRNQKMIDLVIPIIMNDVGLQEEIVAPLLIQIKNKVKHEVVLIDQAQLGQGDSEQGFFYSVDPSGTTKKPYIAITMQFGVTSATPFIIRNGVSSRNNQSHRPCYDIELNGFTPELYPITESHQPAYKQLLLSGGLLTDHPRQTPEALAAVKRLKPFWDDGPEFYDWYDGKGTEREQGMIEDAFMPVVEASAAVSEPTNVTAATLEAATTKGQQTNTGPSKKRPLKGPTGTTGGVECAAPAEPTSADAQRKKREKSNKAIA
ncbi:hypothetical protein BDQ12DRAFT_254389 [Crucibulum laeve]|uniref:Uncharacterized protein n=1 Tax=Crucibulum laeve TaxID=68775 RepID=A0A5C3LTV9_9AGAR|nr:hypothetical protein BDQ12DRAFT_254389 [Crucibulum laeve]